MLYVTEVTLQDELMQIHKINRQNPGSVLSEQEKEEEGFVTWLYSVSLLQKMHSIKPSIIVKDDDKVVGYAFLATRQAGIFHADLKIMIDNIDLLRYKNKLLSSYNFYFMGQVCIDKHYRGKEIFNMLFQKHKELYSDVYELLVTEISTKNYRSQKHMKKLALKQYTLTAMPWLNGMWWFGIGDRTKSILQYL